LSRWDLHEGPAKAACCLSAQHNKHPSAYLSAGQHAAAPEAAAGVEATDGPLCSCRVCHGPAELPDSPLITPCNCRGSIAHIHPACLAEWRRHSRTPQRCTICGARWRSGAGGRLPRLPPLVSTWQLAVAAVGVGLIALSSAAAAAAAHRAMLLEQARQRRQWRQQAARRGMRNLGIGAIAGAALKVAAEAVRPRVPPGAGAGEL